MQDCLLEAEHKLWVDDWRRLGSTSIDVLPGVLNLLCLSEWLDLIDARGLPEHDLEVQISIHLSLTHSGASVPWEESESRQWLAHLALVVIVRAVLLLAICLLLALVCPVVIRMVFLLLPAMAVSTSVLQLASVEVSLRLLLRVPELALLFAFVVEQVRLASEVLPVVCILALVSLVVLALVIEGTPNCLEVEHVEVRVLLHFVQDVNAELVFRVSERAQITELTALNTVRVSIAELALVLLGMIEVFHPVVCLRAVILEWAVALCISAHF